MDWSNNRQLKLAAKWMHLGETVAYPTEAVWGLGCDPSNPNAVAKLLRLKSRPVEKGLILIAADITQFEPLLKRLSPAQRRELEHSWPGPFTWIVPATNAVPDWIRGQHQGVALRVTDHPVAAALCRAFGGPIVSTSANPANRRAARTALAVRRYFGSQIAVITPGQVGTRKQASEIRDLISGRVLRGPG